MLRHINNVFSDGQAFTATADSTNVIDTGASSGSAALGDGDPVDLVVRPQVAFTGLTSVAIVLQDSADNSSWQNVYTTRPYLLSELAANGKDLWRCPLPNGHRRYLKVSYTVVGTGTAGAMYAGLEFSRR